MKAHFIRNYCKICSPNRKKNDGEMQVIEKP